MERKKNPTDHWAWRSFHLLQFFSSKLESSCHLDLHLLYQRYCILFIAIVKGVVSLICSQPIHWLYIGELLFCFLVNFVFRYGTEGICQLQDFPGRIFGITCAYDHILQVTTPSFPGCIHLIASSCLIALTKTSCIILSQNHHLMR